MLIALAVAKSIHVNGHAYHIKISNVKFNMIT